MTTLTSVAPDGAALDRRATVPARVSAVGALVVAVIGSLLGLSGNLDGLLGSGSVSVVRGVVEMATGDAEWQVVPAGVTVPVNARLRAPTGTATLAVPDGAVHLAEGTEVVAGRPFQVEAGSILVESQRDYDVEAGVVRVSGRGAWRVDGGGPSRVGAYRGSAVVADAAGRESLVRPLEELRMRDAVADGVPRPYVYTASDPFDPDLLAGAFAVDDFVAALHRGLASQYGDVPQDPGFFTDFDGLDGQLVADLGDVGFTFVEGRIGPPADVLVAAVVTESLVARAGLAPGAAAGEVRDLRLAGATWGLITTRHDVSAGDVRAAAERALERRRAEVDQGTATPVLVPSEGTVPGDGSTDGADGDSEPDDGTPGGEDEGDGDGGDDGDGTNPPDRPDDGTGAPPPGQGSDQGPVGGVVDVVDDIVPVGDVLGEDGKRLVDDAVALVDDIIEGATDTLGVAVDDDSGDLTDELSDTVEDTADNLGEVVDGVGDTVGGLLGK